MKEFKTVDKGMVEMTEVYECPSCQGHVSFDATFVDQVGAVSYPCPYCHIPFALPDEEQEIATQKAATLNALKDHYACLRDALDNYGPDQVEEEEMEEFRAVAPETEGEYLTAINNLTGYLWDWFPDEVDEEEQEELKELLERSNAFGK